MIGLTIEGAPASRTLRTLKVLREAMPARLHVFRFSPRPGTRAWGRGDVPSPREAEKRSAVLRQLAEEWRLGYIEERRGEIRGLLVENLASGESGDTAFGTTEDFIKGAAPGVEGDVRTGEILYLEIRGVFEGMALLGQAARTAD